MPIIYVTRPGLNNRFAGAGLIWEEVLDCAATAIGIAGVEALAQSGATNWSWPVIKRVFKAAAKRLLGPIGVAIAVVSFGSCIASQAID